MEFLKMSKEVFKVKPTTNKNRTVISVFKDSPNFLEITKGNSRYGITTNSSFEFGFLETVVNMLEKHGDVFAAYVNSIDPRLTREQKEDLVYNFPENIKQCNIQVVKLYGSNETHDWKAHKVNVICEGAVAAEHLGQIYIFTPINSKVI